MTDAERIQELRKSLERIERSEHCPPGHVDYLSKKSIAEIARLTLRDTAEQPARAHEITPDPAFVELCKGFSRR